VMRRMEFDVPNGLHGGVAETKKEPVHRQPLPLSVNRLWLSPRGVNTRGVPNRELKRSCERKLLMGLAYRLKCELKTSLPRVARHMPNARKSRTICTTARLRALHDTASPFAIRKRLPTVDEPTVLAAEYDVLSAILEAGTLLGVNDHPPRPLSYDFQDVFVVRIVLRWVAARERLAVHSLLGRAVFGDDSSPFICEWGDVFAREGGHL
jgi:hypothetical protein